MNPLRITDTTFRDGHQSLIATRLRMEDMEPIAADMGSIGFHSMEVWGGATFDTATRYLAEDPWQRLRTFKRLIPDTSRRSCSAPPTPASTSSGCSTR